MRLVINLIIATISTFLIIGIAMLMIPSSVGNHLPIVTFRYTTSVYELAHMVQVGDTIIDYMRKPVMRVSSVTIRPLQTPVVLPSATIKIINNPQVWEVLFQAIPTKKGIMPPIVVGGSLYIETPRWKKLVRVIGMEDKP